MLVTKQFIIFDQISDEVQSLCDASNVKIYTFQQILDLGKAFTEKNPNRVNEEIEKGQWDDIAAIIFTSGTT